MFSSESKMKNFKINGFKFLQYALDGLRAEVYNYQSLGYNKPLHSSSLAMYIGLVSECSQTGLIDEDVRISDIARKVNLQNSTANNGYHQLLDRGLIRETQVGSKTQIEIVGYADRNKSREESGGRNRGLNYFFVPNELFNTTILAQLVSATSAKGIILLLELCNSFHRDLKHGKESIENYSDVLKMSTLKDKLGLPSATRVRKTLDILAPLFVFSPEGVQVREPKNLFNRIRKAVTQLHIKKFTIHINPNCIVERTDVDPEAMKALKDAEYRLKSLEVPIVQRDRIGIHKAYRSIVKEIAQFIKDSKLKKSLLRDSMQTALMELEKYISSQPGQLKSVGAFLNNQFQTFVINFLDKLSAKNDHSGLLIDIQTSMSAAYNSTGVEPPYIWRKYLEYRASK